VRTLVAVLVVLAFTLAGCFGGPAKPPSATDSTPTPTPTDPEFTPYDPTASPRPRPGTTATAGATNPAPTGGQLPESPASPASFSLFKTGGQWGEPSIGITESGAVFVTAASSVLRSQDHGDSWDDVSSSLQFVTFDPYLWVDPITDRIFHVNLLVGSSFVSYSDNDGNSWTQIPAGGPGDHEKLTSGPPSEKIPGSGVAYGSVLYYATNNQASTVSISLDGGSSWGPEVPIGPPLLCGSGGINGQPHGTPNGVILLPFYDCPGGSSSADTERTVYVAQSLNGATWSLREVPPGFGGGDFDPDLASDQAGNTYLAFMGGPEGNHSLYLAHSDNDGSSWKEPVRVAPDPLGTIMFPTIVAGAEGEVWISYIATDEGDMAPGDAPDGTEWYLYTTHISSAYSSERTITTYLVDPHPVHLGRVSTDGLTPEGETGGDDDRNLLEFIDSTFEKSTGRLWIVYTDGCPEASCTKKSQSNAMDVTVARLDTGPNLLAPGGIVIPPA
jgi:hypothetical protein